jgi:hypothetical protein
MRLPLLKRIVTLLFVSLSCCIAPVQSRTTGSECNPGNNEYNPFLCAGVSDVQRGEYILVRGVSAQEAWEDWGIGLDRYNAMLQAAAPQREPWYQEITNLAINLEPPCKYANEPQQVWRQRAQSQCVSDVTSLANNLGIPTSYGPVKTAILNSCQARDADRLQKFVSGQVPNC